MSATFTTSVASEEAGPFDNFPEAFEDFWERCFKLVDNGTTHMVLETSCWIEGDFDGKKMPLMFYPAKEFAYVQGLILDGGVFVKPAPRLDDTVVQAAFVQCLEDGAVGVVGEALATLEAATAM